MQETEQRLGVLLFERTTRQVQPTRDGKEFLAIARRVLAEYDAALAHFEGYLAGARGSITVAALPSIAATLLPPAILAFRAQRPEVTVTVCDGLSGEVLDRVHSGQVDMAVTVPTAHAEGLASTKIAVDEFSCVFPTGHRFAQQDEVRWDDLEAEPLVAFDQTSSIRWHTDRVLADREVSTGPMTEARNIGAVAGLTAAGLGVTVAPGLVLPMMRFAGVETRPLVDPVVRRDICLLHLPHRPLSRTAVALMEMLASAGTQIVLPAGVQWTGNAAEESHRD